MRALQMFIIIIIIIVVIKGHHSFLQLHVDVHIKMLYKRDIILGWFLVVMFSVCNSDLKQKQTTSLKK